MTETQVKVWAAQVGISVGGGKTSPYPTIEQLLAFAEVVNANCVAARENNAMNLQQAKCTETFRGNNEEMPGRVCLAYLRHSPEDTAIGLGADEEAAMTALIAAYPPAQGKVIEVTSCTMGVGLSSLESAPLLCRTSR